MQSRPLRRERASSAARVSRAWSNAWTQSWQGLQSGEKLQANSITETQVEMIALGGVIGTGLFLGSATALRHAGPGGAFVGYAITGTIVLSITQSLAHIILSRASPDPADLLDSPISTSRTVDIIMYRPPGWNAWYEWTIILPSEIAAAGVLMNTFLPPLNQLTDQLQLSLNMTWTSAFLVLALALNFIGARYYGMLETAFSAIKITTVTLVLISGIVLDLMKGADGHRLGFRYWNNPGAFKAYRSRDALGRFFGLWAVLLQACFSYFGPQVAAMAAAEVRNPRISIPNAARNAWIRISVFYVGSVFVAGLLVPSNDDALGPSNSASKRDSVFSSPFVIAFKNRGLLPVALAMAALFVFSAFSAAVSDVFISSRLLFFMSKCGHAPRWGSWTCNVRIRKLHLGVVPYSGVAVAGVFATLAYLTAADAEQAFHWLSTMTSTACLCSWIGMMWTYLSWDRGLQQAQHLASGGNQYYVDFFEKYKHRIPEPKRRWYRTLRAWYALIMCTLILIFNGWAVFTVPGEWIVARTPNDPPPPVDPDIGQPVPTFITSYLPVPMFLLLVFGYKLTSRTQSVTTERMVLNMKYEWDAEAEEDRVRELHAMSSTRTPSQPESNCLNRPTAILEFLAWSIYGLARGDSSANRR
ncbi:hypothetical protein EXIGLDRAFT_834323 [Exidia glandulosa HHB12029]|uniref:Amino acid permease/ SLC12A domain-containing protein n=1 Tax=Exidia glandulosa HHB12029 TaxID=1314781 RepID=A0A165JY68_EXIGL|nr:hypothetical protein EXIGLDRAFT_834323 [Exidia glandulosa HHB12029]